MLCHKDLRTPGNKIFLGLFWAILGILIIIIIIKMKTYKAQESIKKPLTALKRRNIKKQRSITIQNKINYH